MINYPDYPADWNPLANDAADAAWRGSPMSMFAKGGRAGCMPFEIKMPKEHVEKMAKGGLASQAKNVADAGVGGDTMVIHINKDEYKKLCDEWGEPTINPHTGMPQFTPFWKQSWFAPVAALAGTALMATGVGSSLGAGLLSTLGAGEAAGTTLAGATGISGLGSATLGTLAGNAALGAGIGALTGGGKGALTSGLLAGAGTIGASALGNYLGSANTSTLQPMASDSVYAAGDPTSVGAYGPQLPTSAAGGTSASVGPYGPQIPPGVSMPAASSSGSGGIMSGLTGYLTSPDKMAAAAVGLGALMGGGGPEQPTMPTIAPGTPTSTDPNLTKRLATAPLDRTRLTGPIDYYNYGMRPQAKEQRFYSDVGEQAPVQAAHGGPLSHYVQGGGTGRSDSIPAKLSDGEYVLDATTVSLLGDGSSKAGAKKLDQMRKNIWKHKGQGMAKGNFGPDAKAPEEYMS
jgi:hypothetical protein